MILYSGSQKRKMQGKEGGERERVGGREREREREGGMVGGREGEREKEGWW